MPRRRVAGKREVLPDPVYNSIMVTKFINGIMLTGKKAIDNVAPALEVKSRRIGGATYQVPLEVSRDRRSTLAIRWIVTNARKRGEKTMEDRLVGELLDATNNRGNAVKKRDEVHRTADANKAFAHYRF